MSADQQVRELVRGLTPYPDVALDVEQVRRGARRRRSRRAVLTAGVVGALVAGGIVVAQRWEPPTPPEPTPPFEPQLMTWTKLPEMPLSPRYEPFTVWTGSEVLVVGGTSSTSVGGFPSFLSLRDGAAFDPESGVWRSVAEAPEALGSSNFGTSAVVGETVVVAQGGVWLAYDVGDDEWRRLPDPPSPISNVEIAADPDGRRLYAVDSLVSRGTRIPVQVLDVAADDWSSLPLSPIQPEIDNRSLVMTDTGLVVMAYGLFPRRDHRGLEETRAELWDGESWTRFADTDVNGAKWVWTGDRIVSGLRIRERDSNRQGRHDYRAGALDPATGEWSELPWLPPAGPRLFDGGWPVSQGDVVFSDGYLYDDASRSSTPVHPPDRTLFAQVVALGDGLLMSFGGYRFGPEGDQGRAPSDVVPTNEVWVMRIS